MSADTITTTTTPTTDGQAEQLLSSPSDQNPTVVIVGAGFGGLMLAVLLERIGMEYLILERAAEAKPLGSAMAIGPHLLPVLEQLGMYEDLQRISLACPSMWLYDRDMNILGEITAKDPEKLTGYQSYLFGRPDFFALLLAKVPKHKILMNKRVTKVLDKDPFCQLAKVECKDGTSYEAHLLVGADGTYSRVREEMYASLKKKNLLPKKDDTPLNIGYKYMIGVTEPMDPERYPQLKDRISHFANILGDARLSVQFASEAEAEEHRCKKKKEEWGTEANAEMMDEFRSFASPFGGTMGDLMDRTSPEVISKVLLEHKLFKTWYSGRTVLIGDGKKGPLAMLPSAGQGAVNAMQDAVILSNCLYDLLDHPALNSTSSSSSSSTLANPTPCRPIVPLKPLTAALQSYYEQRYRPAEANYRDSQTISKVMIGQSPTDRFLRNLTLHFLPHAVQQRVYAKSVRYRPQIMWLPLIPERGLIRAQYQRPCNRKPLTIAMTTTTAAVVAAVSSQLSLSLSSNVSTTSSTVASTSTTSPSSPALPGKIEANKRNVLLEEEGREAKVEKEEEEGESLRKTISIETSAIKLKSGHLELDSEAETEIVTLENRVSSKLLEDMETKTVAVQDQ
ncbi:hypothetical protein BGZ83_001257 [Gryganskiella cystojenkinii]|nr:hypothetical protein BGZ83_001257 [Gryganskiella cystojenkinii]